MFDIDERENESGQREENAPMTRAEWVKYARQECEKQLPVFKLPEQEEEEESEILHAVYIPLKTHEMREEVSEKENVKKRAGLFERLIDEEVEPEEEESARETPHIHEPQYDGAIDIKELEPIKWSYMTKLGVRFAAAVVIMLFVITIDFFGGKNQFLNSSQIKTALSNNTAIETMEKSVSAFAKEKVLPLLGIHKEDDSKQTNAKNVTK